MAGEEETKISIESSTTHIKRYEVMVDINDVQFQALLKPRLETLVKFLPLKIGDNPIIWVIPIVTTLLALKAAGAVSMGQNVITLPFEDWDKAPDLPTGYSIIFLDWREQAPWPKWIENGWITNNHYIMSTAKDSNRAKIYRDNAKFIETWVNSEHQMGIKFPDCDKYHKMSDQQWVDSDNIFVEGVDDCVCGTKGSTFIVTEVSP